MQGNISDVIYVLHYYDGVPSFLMAEDVGEGEKEAEEEAEVSVQLVHLLMTGWRCSLLCERLCLFPRAVHKDHMYLYTKRDFNFFQNKPDSWWTWIFV